MHTKTQYPIECYVNAKFKTLHANNSEYPKIIGLDFRNLGSANAGVGWPKIWWQRDHCTYITAVQKTRWPARL